MAAIDYKKEDLTDAFIEEITPLLMAHKDELCLYDDFDFEPDWGTYKVLATAGVLAIFTARVSGVLIGYSVYAVHPNLHYKSRLHAIQDVLYISPEYRGKLMGLKLIRYADSVMKYEGVHLVTHHVKASNDFGPMLVRIGYELGDKLYNRRLN